jgi:hypothetical protein
MTTQATVLRFYLEGVSLLLEVIRACTVRGNVVGVRTKLHVNTAYKLT